MVKLSYYQYYMALGILWGMAIGGGIANLVYYHLNGKFLLEAIMIMAVGLIKLRMVGELTYGEENEV